MCGLGLQISQICQSCTSYLISSDSVLFESVLLMHSILLCGQIIFGFYRLSSFDILKLRVFF
jgi:hypothetical protein